MSNPFGKNGVYLPRVAAIPTTEPGYFVEKLYKIDPVSITAIFDNPSEPQVLLTTTRSSEALELLKRVNLSRGTIIALWHEPSGGSKRQISPDALARLNYFLHIPGHSKGFRGWRIARQKTEGGSVYWKSKDAWRELLQLIKA